MWHSKGVPAAGRASMARRNKADVGGLTISQAVWAWPRFRTSSPRRQRNGLRPPHRHCPDYGRGSCDTAGPTQRGLPCPSCTGRCCRHLRTQPQGGTEAKGLADSPLGRSERSHLAEHRIQAARPWLSRERTGTPANSRRYGSRRADLCHLARERRRQPAHQLGSCNAGRRDGARWHRGRAGVGPTP